MACYVRVRKAVVRQFARYHATNRNIKIVILMLFVCQSRCTNTWCLQGNHLTNYKQETSSFTHFRERIVCENFKVKSARFSLAAMLDSAFVCVLIMQWAVTLEPFSNELICLICSRGIFRVKVSFLSNFLSLSDLSERRLPH